MLQLSACPWRTAEPKAAASWVNASYTTPGDATVLGVLVLCRSRYRQGQKHGSDGERFVHPHGALL